MTCHAVVSTVMNVRTLLKRWAVVLAKRLGIVTVVRCLDVVEFGGIRHRTLRCTELSLLSVRDVFWQRSACVVGMTWCSAMNNTDVSGGIVPCPHVPGIFCYEN